MITSLEKKRPRCDGWLAVRYVTAAVKIEIEGGYLGGGSVRVHGARVLASTRVRSKSRRWRRPPRMGRRRIPGEGRGGARRLCRPSRSSPPYSPTVDFCERSDVDFFARLRHRMEVIARRSSGSIPPICSSSSWNRWLFRQRLRDSERRASSGSPPRTIAFG